MTIEFKPGQQLRVTISKTITRESALKTVARLFLKDKAISGPIDERSSNFEEKPKRRGGCIWTKRPNKVHPKLDKGVSATFLATAQTMKDLKSVEAFVSVLTV